MEYNLGTAIEQLRKKEEAGLNYIYSKTYNYVYLRAKKILKRENEIQQLMKEVYLKALALAAEITPENLYEWLGKCVYTLGCGYYRKKKAREAVCLEIDKNELTPRKVVNLEETAQVIGESMEELPDLYQATFFAFYYDCMSVEEIAKVMDCSAGVIINRLNYTRKYMIKALENYQEEKKIKVAFSVEAVGASLRKWAMDHCLGITSAQSLYGEICKEANLKGNSIYLEGKEFAGVNNTVIYHKIDDFSMIQVQFELYGKKPGIDPKVFTFAAGILVLVIVVIFAAVMLTKSKKEEDTGKNDTKIEQTQDEPQTDEPQTDEPQVDEPQEDEPEVDEPETEDPQQTTTDSEYIFPDSATRALTREDLEGYSKEVLRLGRNEIFARHGMIFGVEDLDKYFSSKSWYQPMVAASDFYDQVEMSLIEEGNITLIRQVEEEME